MHRLVRLGTDDLLLNIASIVLLTLCILVPGTFVLSRMHMLYTVYNIKLQERENSMWLLQQCKQDEFYHNMKHHSSLCDELQMHSRDSVLFDAVEHVIQNSYLCGYESCTSTMDSFLRWATGRGIVMTILFGTIGLIMPSILFPCLRRRVNVMAEERLHSIHHAPYGYDRYVENARRRNIVPWTGVHGEL